MEIIMSPAKLMDFSSEKIQNSSKPLFESKTKELINVAQKLSVKDIRNEMKINPKMAKDVFEYFQTFDAKDTPSKAAAFAYNGIAYKGFDARTLSDKELKFAQEHLNIISGLYGIVRPLDKIKPYRLEMGRKIMPKDYESLYDFWGETINHYLSSKLKGKEKVIINVASKEYNKVMRKNLLPANTKVIEMNFLQQQNDNLKQIVVHTKKARGLMARYIIQNEITKAEDVRGFNLEDYFFYPKLSNENQWYFVR